VSAGGGGEKGVHRDAHGDIGFFLGILWLYSKTGRCCFTTVATAVSNNSSLTRLLAQTTSIGMAVSTGISLLIFLRRDRQVRAGAAPRVVAGRDGGADTGERVDSCGNDGGGGVFLVARLYPLMAATPGDARVAVANATIH